MDKKKVCINYNTGSSTLPAQAPEGKAEAAVRVETDGDLPGRVELTLQFDGATQGTGGSMRHLEETI